MSFAGMTGKIKGRVTDAKTGEGLAGVNIIVENTQFGAATDLDGNYIIIGIPPGTYTVVATYISYRDVRVTDVQVNIDKTRLLNFEMQPSTLELNEEIVVTAERPLFKKDLTSTESTVSKDVIETLPVENLNEIVNLQAGVVEGHFRGGRQGEVVYMVNGIPMNDVYSGEAAITVDNNAIQELNVISGTFNAEYGQAMSGIVNVVTKEGGQNYDFTLTTYGGSYLTSHDDIFWNPDLSPVFILQGTLSGPVPFLGNKLSFFASGRYVNDAGYIYGKNVFLPTDHTTDFLLVDEPEERFFMSHGQMYQFSEELAEKMINDAEAVSMNDAKRLSGNIKLTYRFWDADKINYEFLYQQQDWHQYDHRFRLDPQGIYNYDSKSFTNALSWNHVFSARTFMNLHFTSLSNEYKQYVYDDPYDSRYVSKQRLQDTGANAFVSGGQQMWHFNRKTDTYLFKADLTSQVNYYNQLKFGVIGKQHTLWMHEYEVIPEQENRIAPITSFQNNQYTHKPVEFSVYAQDKIEYEDLVVNIGVRYDYFDPAADVPLDFSNPDISARRPAETTSEISPRLGLAYPISEKGAIHVSYGHFFQTPNFFYLYTNPEFDIDPLQSSVSPPPQSLRNTVGNADLKPQQTTIYELGLQQQIGDIYGLSLTVYFKDIRHLIGTEVFRTQEGVRYARYTNRDYAYVRGMTFDLERRYMDGFALNIDYTYQIAEGNASDPNNAFLDAEANRETEKQMVPLDWDRRHQINASLRIGRPDNLMLSLIARYGTGMPYTPASRVVQPLVENGGRKPDQFNVDLFLTKKVNIKNVLLTFFIKVYNLFDRLNERIVYTDTGRATYSTEPLYFGGERPRGLNTLEDYYIHPDYYSKPRRVLLGLEIGY